VGNAHTRQSVSRINELAQIFIHATNVSVQHADYASAQPANLPQMEKGFWDMGLRAGSAAKP
jgi:hypothetical protein